MNNSPVGIEVDYKRGIFHTAKFLLANASVAFVFSVLWVWEYHWAADLNQINQIDRIVVPWLWLASFFAASFLCLRGAFSKRWATAVSAVCAVTYSFLLWVLISFALVPAFDPHF